MHPRVSHTRPALHEVHPHPPPNAHPSTDRVDGSYLGLFVEQHDARLANAKEAWNLLDPMSRFVFYRLLDRKIIEINKLARVQVSEAAQER